ncbi:MFS-type transporter SLC18B1 [Nymphon striatum]|nr:MFS-type transporter SLC18B1 [Nymphon striatum]
MNIQEEQSEVDFIPYSEEGRLHQPEIELDVPQENAAEKGATETETGFIFSVFALSTMICSPIIAIILPYIGARFMFLSSVFIVGGTSLLFSFVIDAPSGLPFVALSISIRTISGFGYICYKAATFSTIASEFPGKVATIMGINAAAFGVGVSLGPFVGGVLYDNWWKNHRLQKDGHFFTYTLFLRYTCQVMSVLAAEMDNAYLDLAISKHVTSTFNVSATVAGALFIAFQAAYAIACPVVGYIVDKKHCDKEIMAVGLLLQMIAFMFLGPAPFFNFEGSIWQTELALILNAIGQAAGFIPGYKSIYTTVINKGFPDNMKTKSKVSGLFLLAMGSGQFIGPSIGGVIIEHMGYAWACTIIALIDGVVFLITSASIIYSKYRCRDEKSTGENTKLLD